MTDRLDDNSPLRPARSSASPRAALNSALGRLLPGGDQAAAEALNDDAPCFGELPARGSSTGAEGEASAILRRVLPDIYFVNTPTQRSARHLELLGRLRQSPGIGASEPLLDFHEAGGLPLTECTLCAYDEAQPGLLAKLCGTMAALDLSIHTAFIYTLRLGPSEFTLLPASALGQGRAVVLNTFLISESYFGHDRALTLKTQKRLKAELCRVLRGQSSVDGLLARARRTLSPPRLLDLAIENRAHEEQTRILLRAEDSFGVLYRATSALAAMGLDIATAQASTRDTSADDLFFVSGQGGGKLPDDSLADTTALLRARLDEA